MIESLLTSLIRDILLFLKDQKNFFELEKQKRFEKAKEELGSQAFAEYLSHIKVDAFVDDLRLALKENKGLLINLLADFFLQEFTDGFDQLGGHFYQSSTREQEKTLHVLFPQKNSFFLALRHQLLGASYQDLTETIVLFLKDCYESPRIIVQSPLESDQKTKKEIREHFSKLYPKGFITFSINPQLIGGIRFFVDGKVDDFSWFSKIQAIQSLRVHGS